MTIAQLLSPVYSGLNHYTTVKNAEMKKDKQDRPEAYPKPTQTDNQLHNQAEFIDKQLNDFEEKSVSNIPDSKVNQVNDPTKDSDRGGE